ncbi:MAG: hypothetical protein AAGD25_37555 [Cyanobacteria bacterium P01_F01_bin.150]
MEENQLAMQLEAVKSELAALRSLQEQQQESITSLIALSQQQTAIIDQQNAMINRLIGPGISGTINTPARLVSNTGIS